MSLLTEANFFVVIIALIIIFFLLGILFGRLTNRTSRENPVTPSNNINEKSKQPETLGQDNQIKDSFPDLRQDRQQDRQQNRQQDRQQDRRYNRSGNRYYNNYW